MEAPARFGAAAGARQEEAAAGLAPGPGGDVAAADDRDAAEAGAGPAPVRLRQGSAAEERLRADERGRDRPGVARHREDEAAAGRAPDAPAPTRSAGLAARPAPHLACLAAY